MIVVDPRRMETREWVDSTSHYLAFFVPVMKIEAEDEWVRWGEHVRQTLSRRGILIPEPAEFDDWREWAIRFNETVQSI